MFFIDFLKYILTFFYSLTESYGFSIILLSLAVTVMMFPLFWIAEIIQNKERARKAKMQSALDKLKDVTNKREKYYYTKRIYRQYNYSPLYSLSGLLGLVIQIPFFLAAYWMLIEFTPIEGVSFGPIKDLSKPDGLLSYNGLSINILPFVMTVVNLFAVFLYAQNLDKTQQKQQIVIALVFLILLYNLPSALVLYWTMNNVFAIGKNGFIDKVNPVKTNFDHDRYILFKDCLSWLKTHHSKIIFVLLTWSIYFLILNAFYKVTLGSCLTTTMSLFVSFFFLEVVCVLLFLFKYQEKKQLKRKMIITYFLLHIPLVSFFIFLKFSNTFYISGSFVLTLFSIVLFLFIIVLLMQGRSVKEDKTNYNRKSRTKILYFVASALIVIAPLIQYYLNNTIYFSTATVFLYFIVFLGAPLLLVAVTNYLNKSNSTYLYFGVLIALFFTLYTLPIITSLTSLIAENNFSVHIVSLLIITLVFIWLFYNSKITVLLFSIFLLVGSTIQVVNVSYQDLPVKLNTEKSDLYNHLSSKEIKRSPNIYYLLYDSYINENLMALYDIDNSEQMNYLRSKNFQISEKVYSTGSGTLITTSHLLDLSTDGIKEQYSNIIMGNSTVDNLLQKNGYETHYIVGEYFIRGFNVPFGGDYLNNESTTSLSVKQSDHSNNSVKTVMYSILMGEFKFNNEFLLGKKTEDVKEELKKYNIANFRKKPKFLFYHSNYPGHGNGNCHPNESELYAKNIQLANKMMKEDVESILSTDKNAVIIIAGDHGVHRKGNCQTKLKSYQENEIKAEHILDNYGTFLAVKYPDNYEQKEILLLQNVFINIFSYLFDLNNLNDYKLPAKTIGEPLPNGSITNGKITYGADKGSSLEEIFSKDSE